MRARSLRLAFAAVLILAAFGLVAAESSAAVREMYMQEWGLDTGLVDAWPSARLGGMGIFGAAVVDESNEINQMDFGGNIAGLLEDSDGWVLQSWTGNFKHTSDSRLGGEEHRFGNAGARAEYRARTYAIEAGVNWGFLEADRYDGSWLRVRGPRYFGGLCKRIGSVTLGGRLQLESENEDQISEDVFVPQHRQVRYYGQFGFQVPVVGFVLGGTWDLERGALRGRGVDPQRFHEDTFEWTRPVDTYAVTLVREGRGLSVGLRVSTTRIKGGEDEEISWSDVWPLNASESKYFAHAVCSYEEEQVDRFVGVLRVSGPWETSLGFRVAAGNLHRETEASEDFPGSIRTEGVLDHKGVNAVVGVSRRFASGRLLVSVEGVGGLTDYSFESSLVSEDRKGRTVGTLAGFEYFATHKLVLRWGGGVLWRDSDVDEPYTMREHYRAAGGIGYLARGGAIQVSLAVRYDGIRRQSEYATGLANRDQIGYEIGLRALL